MTLVWRPTDEEMEFLQLLRDYYAYQYCEAKEAMQEALKRRDDAQQKYWACLSLLGEE